MRLEAALQGTRGAHATCSGRSAFWLRHLSLLGTSWPSLCSGVRHLGEGALQSLEGLATTADTVGQEIRKKANTFCLIQVGKPNTLSAKLCSWKGLPWHLVLLLQLSCPSCAPTAFQVPLLLKVARVGFCCSSPGDGRRVNGNPGGESGPHSCPFLHLSWPIHSHRSEL